MSNRLTWTGLIPRHTTTYVIAFVFGLCITFVLGGLYSLGMKLSSDTTDGSVAAFDLDSEGSIGCWISVIMWFCCGQLSWLIGRVRESLGTGYWERRGWQMLPAIWFCMSLDEGASLHEGFKELMVRVTGTRLMGDGSIYWAVPYFVVLSVVGLFLLARAWRNWTSIAALLGGGGFLAVAVAGQLDFILRGRPHLETWLEESCELMGQLCVLLALGLYARKQVEAVEQSEAVAALPRTEPGSRELYAA